MLLKVELSEQSRDFQRVALEPGLPMLDSGSNAGHVLRRWLADFAAEAEWRDDHAVFFATHEGRRQLDAVAETVTEKDLKGPLKSEYEELKARVDALNPRTASEQLIAKRINIDEALEQTRLVQYREPGGTRRLVLLWGLERKDNEPATPTVCRKCDSGPWLYLDRKATSSVCPGCAQQKSSRAKASGSTSRTPVFAGLLLLAALAGVGVWAWLNSQDEVEPLIAQSDPAGSSLAIETFGLRIEPENWVAPVGGATDFRVQLVSGDRPEPLDVTRLVHVASSDPRVCRFDNVSTKALAGATGTATLDFRYGDYLKTVNVRVEPPVLPQSLRLEPTTDSLKRGETRRLRVIGLFEGEREIDLTNSATWESDAPMTLFCYDGLLEGITPGQAELIVRYAADPDGPSIDLRQFIEIAEVAYESLALRVEPATIPVGSSAEVLIEATTSEGDVVSVAEGSQLKITVTPQELIRAKGDQIVGLAEGTATIVAQFGEMSAESSVTVEPAPAADGPSIPERMEMLVGEVVDLAELFSVDVEDLYSVQPEAVEVTEGAMLLARMPGTAQIEFRSYSSATPTVDAANEQGTEQVTSRSDNSVERQLNQGNTYTITVDVLEATYSALRIDPAEVVVPIHGQKSIKVFGLTDGGRMAKLAPELLTWEVMPNSDSVRFDRSTLTMTGLAVTDGPQPLLCRFNDLDAAGYVKVIDQAFELVIKPSDEVNLPVGRQLRPTAFAVYGPSRRVEISPESLTWKTIENSDGLQWDAAVVVATSANSQPLKLQASYRGKTAKLTIRATESVATQLELVQSEDVIFPGDQGNFGLRAIPIDEMPPTAELARFESSDAGVLQVNESGEWRAVEPGSVEVTVTHPSLAEALVQTIMVAQPESTGLMFNPDALTVGVGQAARLNLYVVASAVPGQDPVAQPVTNLRDVRLAVVDDRVALRPPWIIGREPCERAEVTAEYQGMTASLLVEVRAVPEGAPIRILPETITAAVGSVFRPTLQQQVPGAEDSDHPESWLRIDARQADWNADDGIAVGTPSENLPPLVTVQTPSGQIRTLTASMHGATASTSIQTTDSTPVGSSDEIVVKRFPEGEQVTVGHTQRYAFEISNDSGTRPASDVRWQPAFANQYIEFENGVLTALAGETTQILQAMVDGRRVRWTTSTVEHGPEVGGELAGRDEQPVAVRVLSNQGDTLQLVVGGVTDAFQVQAEYADGITRDVTDQTELVIPPSGRSAVRIGGQKLGGIAEGSTFLAARFAGVDSSQNLDVQVIAAAEVDALRVEPKSSTLTVGESASLRAVAMVGDEPVGDVSRDPDIVWKSRSPETLSVAGPSVSAVAVGQGGVTAQLDSVISNVAEFSVDDRDQATQVATVKFQPSRLSMRVGQRRQIGDDVALKRGSLALQADEWRVEDSSVVQLEGKTLIGLQSGSTSLVARAGEQVYRLPVRVVRQQRTQLTAPRDRIARRRNDTRKRSGTSTGNVDPKDSKKASPPGRTNANRSRRPDASERPNVSDPGSPALTQPGRGHRPANRKVADGPVGRPENNTASKKARPGGPETVYDFTGHKAENAEPRLIIEPGGGALPVGAIQVLRVDEIDELGRRTDRTTDAQLESIDPDLLRIAGNRVAGIAPGQATLRARLPNNLSASVVFNVTDADAQSLRVEPPHVFINVDEQQSLSVRAPGIGLEATLADRNRMQFRMIDGNHVASVSQRGVVTGSQPGTATVGVSWDGGQEISVPVTVRPREIFSDSIRAPLDTFAARGPGVGRVIPSSQDAQSGGDSAEVPSPAVAGDTSNQGLQVEIVNVRDEVEFSTADIRIVVPESWGDVEFRVAKSNSDGGWIGVRREDGKRIATLKSPPLTRRTGKLHRVLLEARPGGQDRVQDYTLRFQLESRARDQGMGTVN